LWLCVELGFCQGLRDGGGRGGGLVERARQQVGDRIRLIGRIQSDYWLIACHLGAELGPRRQRWAGWGMLQSGQGSGYESIVSL